MLCSYWAFSPLLTPLHKQKDSQMLPCLWEWMAATFILSDASLMARFMGPTWGPPGDDRTQVGPMLAPWTLPSGMLLLMCLLHWIAFEVEFYSEFILHFHSRNAFENVIWKMAYILSRRQCVNHNVQFVMSESYGASNTHCMLTCCMITDIYWSSHFAFVCYTDLRTIRQRFSSH